MDEENGFREAEDGTIRNGSVEICAGKLSDMRRSATFHSLPLYLGIAIPPDTALLHVYLIDLVGGIQEVPWRAVRGVVVICGAYSVVEAV